MLIDVCVVFLCVEPLGDYYRSRRVAPQHL